nr:MAG TPA_asm: hypothetical protein [Caudoviricetes sp.]
MSFSFVNIILSWYTEKFVPNLGTKKAPYFVPTPNC